MESVSSELSLQESILPYSDKVEPSNFFFVCLMILFISSSATTILMVFPQVKVEGGVVPVIFRDRPAYYHTFVVFIVLAFTGAYGAFVIRRKRKPNIERFCTIYAMASMLSALAIVLYAASLWFVVRSPP